VSAAPPAPAASSNPAPEAAGPVAAPGLQSVPAAAAPDVAPAPAADAVAPGASDEFEPTVDLAKLPTVVDPAIAAITWGRGALAGQRLTTPPGNSALDYFQYALKLDPKSKNAKKGIVDIAKKYIELADKGQGSGDLAAYVQLLTQADDVAKTLDEGADVRKDIAARRAKAAEPYLAQAKAAAAAWDKATAKAAFEKALEIDPSSSAARDGVKFVATIGEPGFVFRDKLGDGAAGPELIVLGGGQVAATRRDITRGEFRRYWAAAGRVAFAGKEPNCRDRESIFRSSSDRNWQNPGFEQDDNHPVVCVSWAEAAGFAQWLSRETGKRYRLLSVAEFERIAAGAAADCSSANLADASFNKKFDSRDGAACDDGFAGTAPAGQFPVHGGLFDAGGNVRTWVGACANGAAAAARGCGSYLAKGRSWMSSSKKPPNDGDSFSADVALNTVGFRLARDIEK
jgi:tetratricopeptide (TPR) repeat protein